jgi:predicted transcriptional regulator of viral defense system
MTKTNYHKFKNELENLGKTYFSLTDLKKFYSYKHSSLISLLSRWSKQDLIFHLGKGYWAFDLAYVDYLRLACNLERPSYVSFEYALNYHGMLSQIPFTITLASEKRYKLISMGAYTLEYSHLKQGLFFGYTLKNGAYIAEPEKALLDELYLISLKKRHLSLEELDLSKINRKLFNQWLKKFPNYTQNLAKELKI